MIKLYPYQLNALDKLSTGKILNGGVGSGKSLTALAYYYICNGGSRSYLTGGKYVKMKNPKDLYIITTAQKRENLEWEHELIPFFISSSEEINLYSNKVVIDSWNNIKKYKDVYGAFFIFDEQRVTGSGVWVKSFLNIARKNEWIILSATPGDTWIDYCPVFVANGFYKNKTDFCRQHAVYSYYTSYPRIDHYVNQGRLLKLKNYILVDMDFKRETKPHHEYVKVYYDILKYKTLLKERWNPYTNAPIQNASELCYTMRKIVNSDVSRQVSLLEILEDHDRAIIFYNFDYELDILKSLNYGPNKVVAEYNGHQHDRLPTCEKWVYLVNYAAGNAGWNCVTTDTIIFFSQNYSYKVMIQSAGRIDRVNTEYRDLYYYHLISDSGIDRAIRKTLLNKQKFNETKYISKLYGGS